VQLLDGRPMMDQAILGMLLRDIAFGCGALEGWDSVGSNLFLTSSGLFGFPSIRKTQLY